MNNWYIAKLLYKLVCSIGQHRLQHDEQCRLTHAKDAVHTVTKAAVLGQSEV